MRLIGMLSGTSVDGIDAACVEIEGEPGAYHLQLAGFHCEPWSLELRAVILDACRPDAPLQKITALNFRIGEVFADVAIRAAEQAGWEIDTVDAIASHGQTVWHQPVPLDVGGHLTSGTMQIGEAAVIAARAGCDVVADFRVADMAVGGQGAPLTPFADYALFASPAETRAVQNLGGIGNVTYLRAGAGQESVIAFDTGPANMLLDALVTRLTEGRLTFDKGGELAARGEICTPLLNQLLTHPFFRQSIPRTTGRETFGVDAADALMAEGQRRGLSPEDLLATATALTAESIGLAYRTYLIPIAPIQSVILGGGGVHNRTLVRMLERALAPSQVQTHAAFGIPDDAKEAIAFAILGYETLHGRPSNIPSATGASRQVVLGKLAPAGPGRKK